MPNSQAPAIDAIAECCARIDAMCAGLDEDGWHRRPRCRHGTCRTWWPTSVRSTPCSSGARSRRTRPRRPPTCATRSASSTSASSTGAAPGPAPRCSRSSGRRRGSASTSSPASTRPPWPRRSRRRAAGMVPLASFIGTRLWDYVVHELDIAEALGLDLDAAVDTVSGRRVLDEMLMLLPRAAAKGGVPEGARVARRSSALRCRARPPRASWTVAACPTPRGGGGGAAPSRLPRRLHARRVGAPRQRCGGRRRRRPRRRATPGSPRASSARSTSSPDRLQRQRQLTGAAPPRRRSHPAGGAERRPLRRRRRAGCRQRAEHGREPALVMTGRWPVDRCCL